MLGVYILMPFVFAFIFSIFHIFENPLIARRIAKSLYLLHFLFSSILLVLFQNNNLTFWQNNFVLDETSIYFTFLVSLIFFLFAVISKTFISKFQKPFWAVNFLLLGLINFLIASNNIFIFLISLFWIFLVNFLSSTLFSKKEAKKNATKTLMCDIFCLFISTSLILKEFARYFVLNEINFSFSSLKQYLYKIDDFAISLAFFGFLIIILRLFNFVPFGNNRFNNQFKINPLINSQNLVVLLILGCYLFVKCYINFDYLFYQYQDEIVIYLLLNFIFFVLLILKQKNISKFLNYAFIINVIIAIFSAFSFKEECYFNFIYYTIVICISYSLALFVFMILEKKFKTDNIEEFKKIDDKTKLSQIFISIALLNLASVPILPMFNCELLSFMMMFSIDFNDSILNIAPYILIFGTSILSLATFNVLHKIIVEPIKKSHITIELRTHQIAICTILSVTLVILTFCIQNFFRLFINS